MIGEEGFATRIRQMSKDKVQSERWLDPQGEPMPIGGDNYYKVEYTYYQNGNIKTEKYYDQNDNPALCKAGYAVVYREYDEYDRVVYEKFYGTDGFATILEDGASYYRYAYDDAGNVVKVTKYDYWDKEVE